MGASSLTSRVLFFLQKKFNAKHSNDIQFLKHYPANLDGIAKHFAGNICRSDRNVEDMMRMAVLNNAVMEGLSRAGTRRYHGEFALEINKRLQNRFRFTHRAPRFFQLLPSADCELAFAVVSESCGLQYRGQRKLHRRQTANPQGSRLAETA